jgi:hypothetical protein
MMWESGAEALSVTRVTKSRDRTCAAVENRSPFAEPIHHPVHLGKIWTAHLSNMSSGTPQPNPSATFRCSPQMLFRSYALAKVVMGISTDRRPIGFWLKLVDRLFDERLDETLGDLTRRHWQVLNVLQQGAVDQAGIDARVRPFLDRESSTKREVADLQDRGWIAGTETMQLTEMGTKEFRRLLDAVSADRAQVMAGIASEEYATTVATLERMARNLGWTSPERA